MTDTSTTLKNGNVVTMGLRGNVLKTHVKYPAGGGRGADQPFDADRAAILLSLGVTLEPEDETAMAEAFGKVGR